MKIAVVTPLFSFAGVPLAQVRFARALASRGHEVTLIIGNLVDGFKFSCPQGVIASILYVPNVRSMLWPLVRYLKSEQPDVVFSAEDHLNTVVLLAALLSGSSAKISGSSRVTPFDTYSNRVLSKRWILKQCAKALMPRADALTCVSLDMVEQYRQVFRSPPHICVYNIVADASSVSRMHEHVNHPWLLQKSQPVIVAAGRLAPWKGFADLIHAVSLISPSLHVRLLILGDGPLRDELLGLIYNLGLRETVDLVGYVENPLKYFARADIFALSSLVEGLPNVLVEAMLSGCTPVATDCPTGPREVLQNGKYGYLVPPQNPQAMARAITHALENPIPKALLAEAVTPFEESRVVERHFAVLGLTH
jgi:glycosyltransferase involved in cell wall biosynthesis